MSENVRIDPCCIFCRKDTNEVFERVIEHSYVVQGGYDFQTYFIPFPAHTKCYDKEKGKGKRAILLSLFFLLLGITIYGTSQFLPSLPDLPFILAFSAALVVSLTCFILRHSFNKRLDNKVYNYYVTHRI